MDSQTPTHIRGPDWVVLEPPQESVLKLGGEPSLTAELRAFANACKLHAQGAPFDDLTSSPQVKSASLKCLAGPHCGQPKNDDR